MAIEPERECGYREVGGLYLVSGGGGFTCDRLPLPIEACVTCGEEPRFNRGIAKIRPSNRWAVHTVELVPETNTSEAVATECPDLKALGVWAEPISPSEVDRIRERIEEVRFSDPVCLPPERAWIMWVGDDYTPESFASEAERLGVSKRLPPGGLPSDFVMGEDWVLLAKLHVVPPVIVQERLDGEPVEVPDPKDYGPGVFFAFQPNAVEKIVTDKVSEDELAELRDAGIEPVVVPSADDDHKRGARAKRAADGVSERRDARVRKKRAKTTVGRFRNAVGL
jgi:hypothetical protein